MAVIDLNVTTRLSVSRYGYPDTGEDRGRNPSRSNSSGNKYTLPRHEHREDLNTLAGDKKYQVYLNKVNVSEENVHRITSSHQIHSAIGFTEDHILHMCTRKGRTQGFSFGDPDYHLSKLVNV